MKKKHQEAIDNIMDNFDFEKVYNAMVALDWEWRNEGVPDVSDLRKEARNLLKTALKDKTNVGTGGFQVQYFSDKDGQYVHLSFVIDEWGVDVK